MHISISRRYVWLFYMLVEQFEGFDPVTAPMPSRGEQYLQQLSHYVTLLQSYIGQLRGHYISIEDMCFLEQIPSSCH